MSIVCALLELYTLVIIARAIASFFPVSHGSPFAPVVGVLHQLTEPVFAPVRRVLPPLGMFDFTPVVVLIGIMILQNVLCR
jgi:YggT family protein